MIKRAIVVGGGIGGLAAATALARNGISVTLLEQAKRITEVGAGLQVSPNGLVVLRALGVEPALEACDAVQAEAVVLRDFRAGKQVARLDLTRLAPQRYLFVHRADLVRVLLKAAQEAGVSIDIDRRVAAVLPGEAPCIESADGAQMRSDLVVCADGFNSVGRRAVTGHSAPFFTGQVAWRALVPAANAPPVATVTMGPGRHIVSYPLRGGRLMNLVAVQERTRWAAEGWQHADDPAEVRAAFADFGGSAAALLEAVDTVHLWGLFRHPVAQTWVKGRTVLLGDAAHPTLPFLAQGANLALEDAWVLADVIGCGVPLEHYQDLRKARCEKVVGAASGNAWKYHLQPGPVRWAAHRALAFGSRLAPGLMMRQFNWLYGHDVTRGP